MDDPNITMEEYIRLEEEKAQKRGKVFNCETAKYGKIWYDEDVHDLRSVETKFPAIVFNDNLSSNETLSYEPTVSSLNNNKIEFRISFDESDDEDYTPSVSCNNDLDFFKDFENEFPTIVYNDALTSKSDFSTEPTLCPQHIDELDLKDETSLFEYDEVEQNIKPPAAGRTMPQRLGRLEEEVQGLRQDVRSLRGLVERSMTDQGRFSTWMVSCMTQLMEASGLTY
ncbi:hypothetical protein Tco_1517576 [Tanacetum coccineum]